jgi:monoamine oxidase
MSDQSINREQSEYDVAVVGGGISGVYTAWKLRRASLDQLKQDLRGLAERRPDKRLKVGLFESSRRVGGRLFSLRLPGVPDTPVELGGMRYLSAHTRVVGLIGHFKMASRKLPTEDPSGRNLYYLRGRHFTAADWFRPAFDPPYRLERGERTRSPGSLLIEVALRHVRYLQDDPAAYRNRGFWNLLLDELSDEAYRLVRDAGGYETIVSNWNAADAIPFLLADFKPELKYMALVDGFMALPQAVESEYRETLGGETHVGHRLYRLDMADNGKRISLVFEKDNPDGFKYPWRIRDGYALEVRAAHTVLALPRRAIELLHPDSFLFDATVSGQQFQGDLQAVLPQPGFKIFAAYKEPWWQSVSGVTADRAFKDKPLVGRSLTDLPLRQCYYWVTGDKAKPNSVLMASYNDGNSAEFWAGLARQPERYVPPPEACPPGIALPSEPADVLAPAALVREMQVQLRELHGVSEVAADNIPHILMPYIAVCKNWTDDPFGGGWHFWKIGLDSLRIMRRIRKPFAGIPLYICGEAWSSQQGWVEGALETADEVLSQYFWV